MLAHLSDDALLRELLGRPAKGIRLAALLDLDEPALIKTGLSPREARRVLTVAEIARRHQPRVDGVAALSEPRHALNLLGDLRTSSTPKMVVLLLDRNLRFREAMWADGVAPCALVSPEELIALARGRGAPVMILAHNHLLGDVVPTEADIAYTRRLVAASEPMGVEVVDHIVVSRRNWFSLRAQRLC